MIDFDTNDMEAMHARVLTELQRIPEVMINVARLGAYEAKSSHPYQNRTGKLSQSTKAHMVRRQKYGGEVTISANTPYAEYVRRRGLMSIDAASLRAAQVMEAALSNLVK